LARQPDVAALIAKDAKTLALGYVDMHGLVETVLPKLPELLRGFGPGMAMLNTSRLPSSQVFLRHLKPSVFSLSRTADGVEFLARYTLPGANVTMIAPMMALRLAPAVRASRDAARLAQGNNQLRQIELALMVFENAHNAFPAGYSADANGKPLLSWRVHILPYLGENELYQQFHLDEPWDSPHNKALIARMPRFFRAANSKSKPGMTNYLGVSGADGIFVRPAPGSNQGTTFAKITDGTSNTMMTVEASDDLAVIWTKPGDFAPNKKDPIKGLVGLYPHGFNAGFADGSVRLISANIAPDTLRALFTKSGGEMINGF
jgi:prepilin-type processing-associated H-X9-DG protein